jgi:hypothetical protein
MDIRTLLATHELFLLLGPLFLYDLFLLLGQTLKHQRTQWHARGYSHTSSTFAWKAVLSPQYSWIVKISMAKLGLGEGKGDGGESYHQEN